MGSLNVRLVVCYLLDRPLKEGVRVQGKLQDAVATSEDARTKLLDALVDIISSGE